MSDGIVIRIFDDGDTLEEWWNNNDLDAVYGLPIIQAITFWFSGYVFGSRNK